MSGMLLPLGPEDPIGLSSRSTYRGQSEKEERINHSLKRSLEDKANWI